MRTTRVVSSIRASRRAVPSAPASELSDGERTIRFSETKWMLEQAGLLAGRWVTADSGRRRRVYSLTKRGKREFAIGARVRAGA
jgi:hypothetical protein